MDAGYLVDWYELFALCGLQQFALFKQRDDGNHCNAQHSHIVADLVGHDFVIRLANSTIGSAGKDLQRFTILDAGSIDYISRQGGPRCCFVPIERIQVVTDKLLVKTRRANACSVFS